MSTCMYINSSWFHGVSYYLINNFKRHHISGMRQNFEYFETLSKFRTWSESRMFANVSCGATTSGDWPTIHQRKQTRGIPSGRMCRIRGHQAWKCTWHMKNCQTPKIWPLSLSFLFICLRDIVFACGALAASISVGIVIPSTWLDWFSPFNSLSAY